MPQQQPVTNPRIVKLMELEAAGRIKPEHQTELDTYRNRGLAPASKQPTVEQGKAGTFYHRASGADADYQATNNGEGVAPRGMARQWLHDSFPDLENTWFNDADRQKADAAQRDFIAATLRYESGAAVPPSEFSNQYRTFFPMPGDGPEVIEQKRAQRQRAIEGLKVSAGPAATALDRQGKTFEGLSADSVTDYALGLRDRKPGNPQRRDDGSIAVQMPDGTFNTYPDQASYEHGMADDQLAAAFGGDRNSDGYRAAYKARFGEEPGIIVDVEGAGGPRTIDAGDGAFGSFSRGVGDAATFGGLDELGGVADTLAGSGGDGSFLDRLGRNIDRNRAIMAGDEQNHSAARIGGQLLGGLAIPFGAGARTPSALARVGALSGGAYGFGSGEGGILERAPSALAGAGLGAVGGYAFGKAAPYVGDALARTRPGPSSARTEAHALAEAGVRQDVPMTAADLRPGARNALAYLEASPGGAGPVQDALRMGNEALEDAVTRVGGGTAQTPESMGLTIQNAGARMIDRTQQIKNDLYADAERMAPTTTVRSQSALDAIDRNIAELSETPNANRGLLSLLQDMRNDLVVQNSSTGRYTPRPLSIAAIRSMRTAMRGEIGSRNLTMTDAERRVSQIIDAASSDITDALNRTDPRAAAAYRRADRYYAQRQQYIRDVVQHYTGPRDRPYSGEQAYQRVMSLAGERGDRERLAGVMRGLSPDERADVASTVAASFGRRTVDDDFSPARFVTQAQKMPAAAREAVFGREGAEAINDLIHIATAKRDTANSLNRSRSGQVANYDRFLTGAFGVLGAGGGYAAGGVGGAAAGTVAAAGVKFTGLNLTARLLTNPRFVEWLGRAPNQTTPAQITAHVRRLGNIAARNPTLRGELSQIQQLLVADVGRARAEDGNNRRQEP